MRQISLNLFSGVAGDMLVAGLLDVGASEKVLAQVLTSLPKEFDWSTSLVTRKSLAARSFQVQAEEGHIHRGLSDVLELLASVQWTNRARFWAETAFRSIAEAEAQCHGCSVEEVHFHEVGALDALVDICGACALLDSLDPAAIWATPVAVGSGTVQCAHGAMPVPAPATLKLLEGMPITGQDLRGERATPTGVALLRAWGVQFGSRPPSRPLKTGYGAGTHDFEDVPNFLSISLEEAVGVAEQLVELRTLVDDATGEEVGAALTALHAGGAVEAFAQAALAKKGRPAFEMVVLAQPEDQENMEELLFRHLGTLGIRTQFSSRRRLPRQVEIRDSVLGELPFKVRQAPGGEGSKPEFEALCARAEELGLTPREAADLLCSGEEHESPQ
ncbi:MAG TPA: nickel pincer cofactor biosynthesis protein LarC [Planctomycetota bacterium]|jgi:uncharacterized protein (TIGR00299 family) protein|nr:TIGR00299 family protein [Planctomycetota bacterium]HJM40382.1 nickel pincer cofactor biosynthesis protein LarC [Planctomycetota bacterium]|tara:strand:+ start:14255 stop:15418 length:1164 start_codon:yes stop_codon:yes gene_type:complete